MGTVLRLVREASAAERRYRRQAARLLRDLDRLDVQSMRKVQQRTRALRKAILADMAAVPEWTASRLPAILGQIDSAIAAWEAGVAVDVAASITKASELGSALAGRFEVAAGAAEVFTVVTPENVEALAAASAELVQDVTTTIKKRTAAEARAASLGLKRPFEAIEAVAAFIPPTRVRRPDGTLAFRGPAARAETIVRTETNRAFSFATQRRIENAAATLDAKPFKRWLTSIDGRERSHHADADGQTVPFDKPFRVNGEDLMFPNDPAGSAGNVINCRCTQIPVMPEWER